MRARLRAIQAETHAALLTFFRRPTAMMFTFLFPVILVVIFGALIRSEPTNGGLFTEPATYYIPGYLAVVVLFTPLSRISATVVRYRNGRQFEKLATTPLTRTDWLIAHTIVTIGVVMVAAVLILVLIAILTEATFPWSPVLVPFVIVGTALFAGIGACIGRLMSTEDGAIAVANTIALPMLFLADTFVPPALLPEWFSPVIALMPLTYFSRGVRAATMETNGWMGELVILLILAAVAMGLGRIAIPRSG